MNFYDLKIKLHHLFLLGNFREGINECNKLLALIPEIEKDEDVVNLIRLTKVKFQLLQGEYTACKSQLVEYETNHGVPQNAHNCSLFWQLKAGVSYYFGNYRIATELAVIAIKYYEDGDKAQQLYFQYDHFETIILQAKALLKQRRFIRAIELLTELIVTIIKYDPRRKFFCYLMAKSLHTLGLILMEDNDFGTAKVFMDMAYSILEHSNCQLAESHIYRGVILIDLANRSLYEYTRERSNEKKIKTTVTTNFKFVKQQLSDAKKILIKADDSETHRYYAHYYRVESFYLSLLSNGNWKEALNSLELARTIRSKAIGGLKTHPDLARLDNYSAKISLKSCPEKYEEYYESGINASHITMDVKVDDIGNVIPRLKLLYTNAVCMVSKVNSGLIQKKDQGKILKKAFDSIDEAIKLLNRFNNYFQNKYGEELVIVQTRPFFELAVEVMYYSQELRIADFKLAPELSEGSMFKVIQQTTNLLLWRKLVEIDGMDQNLVSPTNFARPFSMTAFMSSVASELKSYLGNEQKKNDIPDLNTQLRTWIEELPNYKRITKNEKSNTISNPELIELAEIQKNITRKTTGFLEYCVSPDKCFATVVTKSGAKTIQLTSNRNSMNELRSKVDELSSILEMQIRNNSKGESAKKKLANCVSSYHNKAHALYESLFKPIADQGLLDELKELYIIPDDFLWRIPFEGLVSREITGDNKAHYLIKDFKIVYNYSVPVVHQTYSKLEPSHASEVKFDFIIGELETSQDSLDALWKIYDKAKMNIHKHPLRVNRFRDGYNNVEELLADLGHGRQLTAWIGHGGRGKHSTSIKLKGENRLGIPQVLNHQHLLDGIDLLLLLACNTNQDTQKGIGFKDLTRALYTKKVKNIIYSSGQIVLAEVATLLEYLILEIFTKENGAKIEFAEALRNYKLKRLEQKGCFPAQWVGINLLGCMTYTFSHAPMK